MQYKVTQELIRQQITVLFQRVILIKLKQMERVELQNQNHRKEYKEKRQVGKIPLRAVEPNHKEPLIEWLFSYIILSLVAL